MSIININGTFALFFANLIGKVFGAIYRIPLSNLLGAEGIGIYQMAFPVYSFLLTFVTGGISITLTRKIAKLRASNNLQAINKQFALGKRTSMYIGFIFTFLLVLLAYPFSFIQGNLNVFYGYLVIAIGFVSACLLGSYRGYYQGYGDMRPTAISQLIEQGCKLIFGLLFASLFIRYNLILGVCGALLGTALGEIVSLIYFKIKHRHTKTDKLEISRNEYFSFIKECIPVSLNYTVLPLSTLIDSFLIVNLLNISGFTTSYSTSLYGIETGMILPLINMPNVLISAIALVSISHISYKIAKGEDIADEIAKILKIAFMFILPCVVGMFLLAQPILTVVYPTLSVDQMSVAVNLLKLSTFEMFFLCFVTITNSIMQALEKTKHASISLFSGVLIKIAILFILVTNVKINIYGLTIASTLGYFICCSINLYIIKKKTHARLSFKQIFFPIFSSVIMIALLLLAQNIVVNMTIIKLFFIVCLSAVLYFSILYLTKQWSFVDVKNMLINKKIQE